MTGKWTKQADVTVPASGRRLFHGPYAEGAYRWGRLALYLDFGRNMPEFLDDCYIENAINEQWEQTPPPFSQDR